MSAELNELAAEAGRVLRERGDTIAVSESACGGLINAALVAVPGASAYYLGGAVIYTGASREGLLSIGEGAMTGKRASTEEYALMTARAIRAKLGATWAIGETGASGPTGNRYGDAAGHACIAVVGPSQDASAAVAVTIETGDSDRNANMSAFAQRALALLIERLREERVDE